jgi:hypothetical protein
VGFGLRGLALAGILVRAMRVFRGGGDGGGGGAGDRKGDPDAMLTSIALVGALVATVVVGVFDAVLLLAAPAFLVWTLLGALAPPAPVKLTVSRWVYPAALALVLAGGAVVAGRSGGQLIAMWVYGEGANRAAVARAAWFDPGSYRIQLRAATLYRARGDCVRARSYAQAAHDLLPAAPAPARILKACPDK